MAQDIENRSIDDSAMSAVTSTDVQNDNTNLADNAIIPIAIGDPLVPGQMDMSELLEYIFDNIATWIAAGSNVSVSSSKSGGTYTLTINATDTDTQPLTAEQVYDHVASFVSAANSSVTVTENDNNNTITFSTPTDVWLHQETISETAGQGDTANGETQDYVQKNLTTSISNTMRRFTLLGRMDTNLDSYKPDNTNDVSTDISATFPYIRFSAQGARIGLFGHDGAFIIAEYRNTGQIRIYVENQDTGDNARYLGIMASYV